MPPFRNPHEEGFAFFRNYHPESAAPLPGPSQRHNGRAHSLTNSGSLSFQKIALELSLTWSPWPGPSDLAPQPMLGYGASMGQWAQVNPRIGRLLHSPNLTSTHELVSVDAQDTPHPRHPPKPAEFREKTGGVLRPFFLEILLAGLAAEIDAGEGPCTEHALCTAAKISIPCDSSKLYDELFAPRAGPVPATGVPPRVGQDPCLTDQVILRLVNMPMDPQGGLKPADHRLKV